MIMRDLLRANNADLRKGVEWHDITVRLEDGKTSTEPHPKRKPPASMDPAYQEKRAAEFAKRTMVEAEEKKQKAEEKIQEIEELRSQVKALADQNEQLMDYVKRSLEKDNRKIAVKETDPLKMKYLAKKKWLKEHGVALNKGDNANALIRKVLNGNSARGSQRGTEEGPDSKPIQSADKPG